MILDFLNKGDKKYNNFEKDFLNFCKKTFDELNIKINYVIDVTIVSNVLIKRINKKYRNIDKVTDVISFAYLDDKTMVELKNQPEVPLGEIIISYQKANEQAIEYNHSLKREMCFLFVHGLLHLLGYDHMNKNDETIMFDLQNKILGDLK